MKNSVHLERQIQQVASFEELVSNKFAGTINAMCWDRILEGDFAEIVNKIECNDTIKIIQVEELLDLELSEKGIVARQVLLNDLKMFEEYGAAPVLNIIQNYERDKEDTFFTTDVYSFHVDRATVPTDTYLCTYYGATSEIVSNEQAKQKILIPEIRSELKSLYQEEEGQEFEGFLSEYFFDLHYKLIDDACVMQFDVGQIWKLAIDYPECPVLPCIHRAPKEKSGEKRLLLIC
ncbi:hypothetical protein [Flavobacterium tegetincola]|uniref:hypothetical protein n=1 Tax=Flavobacterium tegetincola TaxID=150172 RepID=UPI000478D5C9|nr:hypothetical protein [Flavobacterium tegetincola]